MPEPKTSQVNRHRLGQYVLDREIGHGGHGMVYQGYRQNRPAQAFAIKVVESTGNLDTLLVEPELLSRLQHPNIVGLQDYFLHEGQLVLVMDYIDGIDLKSLLKQHGRFSPEEIKAFLTQMADALSHAHAQNIMHRDLKLSNILVTATNGHRQYVLVDFGISRITEGIQMVRQMAGTLSFMAPEQLRGRPSTQSDLWALGVIAYTLLTGSSPFDGDTTEILCRRILFTMPQPPSAVLAEEVDADLERIIYHLLEKEPISRTLSAVDLLAELEEWPSPATEPHGRPTDNVPPSKPPSPTWEQRNRSNVRKSWILLCLFLFLATIPDGIIGSAIVIGGVIIFFLGQERDWSILYTVAGFGLMVVGVIATALVQSALGISDADPEVYDAYLRLSTFISLPFYILALNHLVKIRRLEREVFLLRTLRTRSMDTEKLVDLLGDFVDVHLGDINIHQKYVETLLSFGRLKEAIVEAQRIIEIDPYNFGANLMLAHGYFEVGLHEECLKVCNGYLAISGYSFEFSDLRDQCTKHLERVGYG